MAIASTRFGSALLALNTLRPPDLARGSEILHLELSLPRPVANEIAGWENGTRKALNPKEAAYLLWTLPVATLLDGRTDAWRDVAGVSLLLPTVEHLAELNEADWPENQAELQALVEKLAPGNMSWNDIQASLNDSEALGMLNDLVLIFKYAAVAQHRSIRTAADLYRLACALVAEEGPVDSREVVLWLAAPLIVPEAFTRPSGPRGPKKPDTPPRPPRPPHFVATDLLASVDSAILARIEGAVDAAEKASETARVHTVLRAGGVADRALLGRVTAAMSAGPETAAARSASVRPPETRQRIINVQLFGAPVMLDVAAVEMRRDRVRKELARNVAEGLPQPLRDRVLNSGFSLDQLDLWPEVLTIAAGLPSYLEPAGRNDLLLVRQMTTGYRRAEIAYAENIMIGESRQREHTHRTLSRQEFIEQIERETEATRDLQVADKAELAREVSKVVQENLRAEGNVQVTSRGPTTVVASVSAGYQRATEEAAKSAEQYSRETIERAVKRTLERVTRESRTLFEQETNERNRHAFTLPGNADDHVSGVYQYLERVSRAKIFWYGERELYDILVPEPAALIWQFAISRHELHIPVEAPDSELFSSITLANIAEKRESIIRAFRVTDMPVVPEPDRTLTQSFSSTAKNGDSAKYATGKELQVPDGYVVESANVVISAEVEGDIEPNGGVAVGNDVEQWKILPNGFQGEATVEFTFTPPLSGPSVAYAINADNFTSLAGTITIKLKLTDAAREQWALEAYGRIAERFEILRREYASAVVQASANQPQEEANLPDGSRLWLQQLVRGELQRAAIDIMRNRPVDYDLVADYPYVRADGKLDTQPVPDLDALRSNEAEIRFLQQAFEWEHLGWILYPYFWGRRSDWSRSVVTAHPDPDFTAFLNAGAARLQIPVRPGFESMVKHFMETGEVYEGEGLPKMGDAGYVTFIDEQLTTLGAPGDEIAWPPDKPREWDVVAPTPLLLLRSADEERLPRWDPNTGAEE